MARNYMFDSANIYTHFVDYPDGVLHPSATLAEPPTLEKFKYKWESGAWNSLTLQESLEVKRADVKSTLLIIRAEKLKEPPIIPISETLQIPVQTRDQVDLINVLGVVLTALMLSSKGITDPVINFRDAVDVNHTLTPEETINMGLAVQSHIGSVYQASWTIKQQIEDAATLEELDNIDLTL